jgi:hypothetical protein
MKSLYLPSFGDPHGYRLILRLRPDIKQARARAEAEVGRIAHSMALEDQAVSARETESLIEARAQEWLDKPGLWG